MNVVPLNDKIVVKRLEAESTTAGGIVLPDTAKEKPKQGRVISLGDGKLLDNGKRAKFQVKEGDRVLFTSYAGNEAKIGSEEYLIMTEDEILANSATPTRSSPTCLVFTSGLRLDARLPVLYGAPLSPPTPDDDK